MKMIKLIAVFVFCLSSVVFGQITKQPTNVTVSVGQTATFTVGANQNTSPTYQWQENNANISGATGPSYTTPPVTAADDGSSFRCVITYRIFFFFVYTVTSNAVQLSVNGPTLQPPNITGATAGNGSVKITWGGVNGADSYNLYYAQGGGVSTASAKVANATSGYTVTGLTNGKQYTFAVTAVGGGVESGLSGSKTVTPQAQAPSGPPSYISAKAGNGQVTVTWGGVADANSYNLYYTQGATVGKTGTKVSSVNSPYTLNGLTNGKQYAFAATAVNAGGESGLSGIATATPVAPLTITTQPQSQSVVEGKTATFTIVVSGSNPTYQWQKNYNNIAGANGASFTTPAVALTDNGTKYRCVVSAGGTSINSNDATLNVSAAPPVITGNPTSVTVLEGKAATFSVTATGNPSFQWQKNGAAITANGNSATYIISATTLADSGNYRCIATNAGGKDTSNTVRLTVNLAIPLITNQLKNQSARVGTTVSFTITATGSSRVYQWQKNNASIANANASSYTTPSITLDDSGATFRCIVGNSAGSDTSNSAVLIVNDLAPSITSQPKDQTVSAGKIASFSIVASGTNLNYQWQKNGRDIPNADTTTYTTSPALRADSGATFTCVVYNSADSVTSDPATLNVNTPKYTVTIGNDGNGLTSPDGKVTVYYGDSLHVNAIPLQYYRFDHWQTDSGSAYIVDSTKVSTQVICTKGNAMVNAYFTLANCVLTIGATLGGHVVPNGSVSVEIGSPITVHALADNGYRFDHWSSFSGSPFIADSTSDSTLVALLSSAEIQAIFTNGLCTLTVKAALPTDTITVFDTIVPPGDTVGFTLPTLTAPGNLTWHVTGGSAIILDSSSTSPRIVVQSANVTVVGMFGVTAVKPMHQVVAPSQFGLRFQQTTGVLFYDVPIMAGKQSVAVKIRVFDAQGRQLQSIQKSFEPGYYHVNLFGGTKTLSHGAQIFAVCVMESEGFKKAITVNCLR